jgi:collagenase-like PrtC family protease
LARELNAKEIEEICENKRGMKIQIQIGGYPFVMHSRWQLITNFKNTHSEIKDNLQNKKLFIQEETRSQPLIVYEDENGTHMLASYNLSLLDKIKHFEQIGIDTIRIDSFLHDAT